MVPKWDEGNNKEYHYTVSLQNRSIRLTFQDTLQNTKSK